MKHAYIAYIWEPSFLRSDFLLENFSDKEENTAVHVFSKSSKCV